MLKSTFLSCCLLLSGIAHADLTVSGAMAFKNGSMVGEVPEFAQSVVSKNDRGALTLFRNDDASNVLVAGVLSETKMNFDPLGDGKGMAAASFGMYGVVHGVGDIGTWGVHDLVGVHGTCYKDFNGWCAGGHFDVYNTVEKGTAIGVNVEIHSTKPGDVIGVNIQPDKTVRGVTGIQLQFPETYKYGIVAANVSYVFGMTDDVPFGFRYNSKKQYLEFFRNIGQPNETRRGYINMNFEAPDTQLNTAAVQTCATGPC